MMKIWIFNHYYIYSKFSKSAIDSVCLSLTPFTSINKCSFYWNLSFLYNIFLSFCNCSRPFLSISLFPFSQSFLSLFLPSSHSYCMSTFWQFGVGNLNFRFYWTLLSKYSLYFSKALTKIRYTHCIVFIIIIL